MIDLVDRHRALQMLGVVRSMVDVDDDPWELDETSAAIVDALDAFDETRAAKPLRIPKGFEGGGRFRRISDAIFARLQDWAKGDVDNPFEGGEFTREHLRKAAKERGLTLRRGATFNEIANQLLDDVRKGKGRDAPDAKPAKKATPRAPAKKVTTDPESSARQRQADIDTAPAVVEEVGPGARHDVFDLSHLSDEDIAFYQQANEETKRRLKEPKPEPTPYMRRFERFAELGGGAGATTFHGSGAMENARDRFAQGESPTEVAAYLRYEADRLQGRQLSNKAKDVMSNLNYDRATLDAHRDGDVRRLRALADQVEREEVDGPTARLGAPEVDDRIRDAYRDLARRPGDWVPLADLRDRLGDMDRRDVDAALERLSVTTGYSVIPWDNRKALTDRDRAASVRIGGDETHAIRIEPELTPEPTAPDPLSSLRTLDPEAARDALDLKTIPQLKPLLKSAGLPVSGRKRELVDRLVGHLHPRRALLDAGDPSLTAEESGAIRAYQATDFTVEQVQTGLRTGDLDPDLRDEVVTPLDAVMARSHLDADIRAHRGIYDIDDIFPGGSSRSLVGEEWTDPAFISATDNESEAEGFAFGGPNPTVMHVSAPAGTPAVRLVGEEAVTLLGRGLQFRVTSDSGPGGNPRRLDVEVVPTPDRPERDRREQGGADTESKTDELLDIARQLAAGEISKAQAAKLRRSVTQRSDDMDAETRDRVLALAEMRFADEMRGTGPRTPRG